MSLDSQNNPLRLGRFDVVERLAVGGMADIFLAVERGPHGLERRVVIKRILAHLTGDASFRQMFLHEARIAAQISHPNVVQIFELGETSGLPFLAMEYVPGITLRDLTRITEGSHTPIPLAVSVQLVAQACAGAHAVHELRDPQGKPFGLVHRDLTPHNLMVTRDGWVKLIDFGIAKGSESEDFTRTGMLKGKLAYMSPEQVQVLPLDRRSDVFALGVVLWELLAGERLFKRDTEIAALRAILAHDVKDVRTLRPEVPDGLRLVLETALEADPNARWETADAMRRALEGAAADAQLELSRDGVGDFLQRMAGDHLREQDRNVGMALERSLTMTGGTAHTLTHTASPASASLAGAIGALATVAGVTTVSLVSAAVLSATAWYWLTRPIPRPEGEAVLLALAPVHDAAATVEEWTPLRAWLEQRMGQRIDLVSYDSYEKTANALLSGAVQYAALPPAAYIHAREHNANVALLVHTLVEGADGYDALMLVKDSSPAASLIDIRDTKVCFTDPQSTSGYLLPRLALRRAGLNPETDLGEVRMSGSHDQAIADLIEGRCDAAATYTDALVAASNRGLPTGTVRILGVTGRAVHDALAAGPSAPQATTQALREALIDFRPETDLKRQKLGPLTHITGFSPGDDGRYDALREALAQE